MKISVPLSATPFLHRLRRRLEHRVEMLTTSLSGFEGTVLLIESGKAATLAFGSGRVSIEPGESLKPDLKIVDGEITGDQNALAKDMRRALAPLGPDWRTAADEFWCRLASADGGVSGLTIVCTDDGENHILGSDSGYAIHASGSVLAELFTGEALLAELVLAGLAQVDGSLASLSSLTGAGMELVLHG